MNGKHMEMFSLVKFLSLFSSKTAPSPPSLSSSLIQLKIVLTCL